MSTGVNIDEHASLLHRSSYYLSLPDEDKQKKRSIKLTTRSEKVFLFLFYNSCFLFLRLTSYVDQFLNEIFLKLSQLIKVLNLWNSLTCFNFQCWNSAAHERSSVYFESQSHNFVILYTSGFPCHVLQACKESLAWVFSMTK